MANHDMNRLMDNARIHLPGALDSSLQYELFSVMNEFFQNSNIWYEDITFTANPTTNTYFEAPQDYTYYIVPTSGVINRLMYLRNSQGYPQAASMAIPGELILDHAPNATDTYTARVCLTVTDPTTREGYPEFPGWILNKYGNDILDGLIGRMMGQMAKPYSNNQLAMYHLKRFQGAVSQAKVEAMHRNVYRGQAWNFPQTFARRRYTKF